MSIETVGSFNQLLKNFDSKSWVKSAEVGSSLPSPGVKSLRDLDVPTGRQSFGELLASSISEVNDMQIKANEAVQKLATGKTKDIAETMLAVEQAEIAFKTMNQIRHKVVDAYKEIMRMQV